MNLLEERKFDPTEPRDPHSGKWADGPGGAISDALKLAGRIQLGHGETLAGSSRAPDNGGDFDAVFAKVVGPSGAKVRFGTVLPEDARRWRAADKGRTVELDADGVKQLEKVVADAPGLGKASVADYYRSVRTAHKAGVDPGDFPDPDADVARGVIAAGWGDVHWSVTREADTGPELPEIDAAGAGWSLALDIVPAGADPNHLRDSYSISTPAQAKRLGKALGDVAPDATSDPPTRHQTEEAWESMTRRALEHPPAWLARYNDFHAPAGSSTGGQFSSGGSSSSSSATKKQATKKAAPKHHAPAHRPSSGSHGNLSFDGHRGPGYGMKNGDPAVHKVQDDLVRLGLAAKGDKNLSDGKYGPKTSAAVKRAQKALGLKADGIATPAFVAKLAATKTLPKPHRSAGLDLCVRSFGFEFEERAAGDGRTLEGYAAIFNSPTRIRDVGGDFDELIHPGAFTRSIRTRMPILQWDHGKDPRVGTVPIGQIQDLAEDSRGLHVRARLYDNPVVEPVRQAIEGKSIKGMSFRFGVPEKGDEWSRRSGEVDLRGIRDADVHELGPVAFPAYDDTSVSVRSLLAQCDPDERRALIRELADELRQYTDLTDLTGQSDAGSDDGGDPGAEPEPSTTRTPHLRQRLDEGALRARGILK